MHRRLQEGVWHTFLALAILIATFSVHAEGNVVINELMWDGVEYIELLNTSNDNIALAGWKMTRQQKVDKPEDVLIEFDEDDTIPAEGFFVIAKNETASSEHIDKIVSGLLLHNDGNLLKLYDNTGAPRDQVGRLGPWFAGENTEAGISMERASPESDGLVPASWRTSTGLFGGRFGTPGIENSQPPANTPPEATLEADPSSAAVGEEVMFSAEGSSDVDGDELNMQWDFGDGTGAQGEATLHTYAKPGTYLVRVTVSDGHAESSAEASMTITASPSPETYSTSIVINEFLPNPVGSDTEGEFIELQNTSVVAVNLAGWKLDDGEGGSSPYGIPAGVVIPPNGFLVFYRPQTKIILNNDSDRVRLISPDGIERASASYNGLFAEGQSFNRTGSSYEISISPTPGAPNVITKPSTKEEGEESETLNADNEEASYQYSTLVYINEFLPNPVGSDTTDEFIELINTSTSPLSLTGWQLDDEEGGSKPYVFPASTTLAPKEVRAFMRKTTGLALNNTGDTVRLIDPSGKVVSSFTYSKSVAEGYSYNRVASGGYVLSSTPTLDEANVIHGNGQGGQVAGSSTEVTSIEEAREAERGSIVSFVATISAPPNLLGQRLMYVAGSGIQIFLPKDAKLSLALGQQVRVTGELSSLADEARVKVAATSDIVALGQAALPEPHPAETGDIDESLEGYLIVTTGTVTRSSGSTFYIDDGSGETRVVIQKSTGIVKPAMSKGMNVTIIGVVSQTRSGYRVLPRYQIDMSVVSDEETVPWGGQSLVPTSFPFVPDQALVVPAVAGAIDQPEAAMSVVTRGQTSSRQRQTALFTITVLGLIVVLAYYTKDEPIWGLLKRRR